ncbi:MAG: DoxX family membrane protein [Chitinophagaceae bacterium]|nr:DoxX family membrane protein [Chitinophagaceae bacterium]
MENIRPFPTIQSFGDVFFAFFRAALGLLLLFRDIDFIFDMSHLEKLISSTGFTYNTGVIAYLISSIHLFGGALIVLGLLTRIAIILQIPIVLAAVLFNMMSTTYGSLPELILSFTILVLLVFYLVKGPGMISMDHYRKLYQL